MRQPHLLRLLLALRALGSLLVALGSLVVPVLGSGCTTGRYLAQAGCGQLDLTLRARTIDGVLRDEDTPPRIRTLLGQVSSIKVFGERHGLTATNNYTHYVGLDRPAVVWVVSAAEPLRFRSTSWWFPIVGSVPYLGWFDPRDAAALAEELRGDGLDVDVGQASAYSTLGWFRDPVLSTMIPEGDEALGELADTVLHESLHATLYLPNETPFNESVANFTGGELAKGYLDATLGPSSLEKAAYVDSERRGEERSLAMHRVYAQLERLYASPWPPAEKLAEKRRVLEALRAELGYRRPITNATLAQFRNYNSGRGELSALLAACGGSWQRFLAALRTLGRGSFREANQKELAPVVLPLLQAGCPSTSTVGP